MEKRHEHTKYTREGSIRAETADGLFVKWDDDKAECYFLRSEIPHGHLYHVGHRIDVDLNGEQPESPVVSNETHQVRRNVDKTLQNPDVQPKELSA